MHELNQIRKNRTVKVRENEKKDQQTVTYNIGNELSLIHIFGSATTVSCYVMAKNMGHEGVLTSSIVMLTTMFLSLIHILFLLAAASYFVGIIYREFGGKMGAAFYIAGVTLGFIVSPNKFYIRCV